MTLGTIIDNVFDATSPIEGIKYQHARRAVRDVYRMVHTKFRFPETLTSETFTWGTSDGTSIDASDELTGWRGKVQRLVGSSSDWAWAERPFVEIIARRDGNVQDELFEGRRAFGVQGANLIIVAALGSDTTMTIDHYKRPEDLGDTSGDDEEPLMSEDYHEMLRYGAISKIFQIANANSPTKWQRITPSSLETTAASTFSTLWEQLIIAEQALEMVKFVGAPTPHMQGLLNMQSRRRRYNR